MFLRRPARTRRPPRSRISLIIAKAISTRRLRRHRTAGRLSVLDTPKACDATTRAHLIHVRCQYAARFTDAFYIYFEGAAHVWTVQVARTSFALSPNHPSRCGTATIALSSRNRTFSKTRLLLGFSVSVFRRRNCGGQIASSAPLLTARLRSFTTAWFKWYPWTMSARLHTLPRVKCVSMARRRLSVL